jgi:catechol 2,3-dioxygenase-like lactoylglutathione lyase family enzyme
MSSSPSTSTFAVKCIDHVVLRVVDIECSIDFYRHVLGCDIVKRRDDLGLVHVRAGASMIDLVRVDGPLGRKGGVRPGKEGRNMDHLCLRIEPFNEAEIIAHLEAHSVEHSAKAQVNFGAEGDGPSIYLFDPDGNEIELKGRSMQE